MHAFVHFTPFLFFGCFADASAPQRLEIPHSQQQSQERSQSQKPSRSRKESEVFGWSRSRIHSNTRSRNRIFLSDSDAEVQLDPFHITLLSWDPCWNGTISFETFVGSAISCCEPRFPLITNCYKIVSSQTSLPSC